MFYDQTKNNQKWTIQHGGLLTLEKRISQLVHKMVKNFKGYNHIFEIEQHGRNNVNTLQRRGKQFLEDGRHYRKYIL